MRIYCFLIIITSFLFQAFPLSGKTIWIKNQDDFDNLGNSIKKALAEKQHKLTARFSPGEYFYYNKHIFLSGIHDKHFSLCLKGENVIIKGRGIRVTKFNKIENLYLRGNNLVNGWTDFYQSLDTVEIIDTSKNICRIKHIGGSADTLLNLSKYIQLTLWFKSAVFPITKIETGYIYFDAGEYAKNRTGLKECVNMDYAYAKRYPRYRLFGSFSQDEMFECQASCFLSVEKCAVDSLIISGLTFNGCSRDNHLIVLSELNAKKIIIKDCSFHNIGGAVVKISNTNNVCFEKNIVNNVYGSAIFSDNSSSNTIISHSQFSNLGLKMSNSHGVLIQGGNFLIEGNRFENFSYSAIGVGVHYSNNKSKPCFGKISHNEIFLSGDYIKNPELHSLMDSGAIYVWTQTEGIDICYNYIHDIIGIKDNRGIFCDDGTKNITIHDNIITNIANSHCISLRECAYVAPFVPDYNRGNTVINNFTDGTIRFFEKDSSCLRGDNYSLKSAKFRSSNIYKYWKRRFLDQ